MVAEGGGIRTACLLAIAFMGDPDDSAWRGVAESGQVRRLLVATTGAIDAAMPAFRGEEGDDRSLAVDRLRESLAERAIAELEIIVSEGRDLAELGGELLLMADDVPVIISQPAQKACRFKRRDDRGLWCTADVSGNDSPTSEPVCRGCSLPNEAIRCSALTHPRIQELATFGGARRTGVGAFCDAGYDKLLGDLSPCRPGGNDCWRRDTSAVSSAEASSRRVPVERNETPGPARNGGVPGVFISYSHQDKPLAQAIAEGIRDAGYQVWIDEGEVVIGTSLVTSIAKAVEATDYLVAIVSSASVDSPWCQKELAWAVTRGLTEVRELVLPVKVGKIEMPPVLGDIYYGTVDPAEPSALIRDLCVAIQRHEAQRPGKNPGAEGLDVSVAPYEFPEVVVSHPNAIHGLSSDRRAATNLRPMYLIENKGSTGIRDVVTGVRTRAGENHELGEYRAQLIGSGESSAVRAQFAVPESFMDGSDPNRPCDHLIVWAQFTMRDGSRWEVAYDPAARRTSYRRMSPETAKGGDQGSR